MSRLAVVLVLLSLSTMLCAAEPVLSIPRVDNITIDGKSNDWADKGFQINILASHDGHIKPAADLDAKARLAWDDRGLLFLITVIDDTFSEAASNNLWEGDGVDMFIADKPGSTSFYQLIVTPGLDPKHPEPRTLLTDRRNDASLKQIKLDPKFARTPITADGKTVGYTLEVLFPWDHMGIQPAAGREFAFQFYVYDRDAEGGDRSKLLWFPQPETFANPTGMQALRLADAPSPPVNAVATTTCERFRRTRVNVLAAAELAGRNVIATMAQPTAGKPATASVSAVAPLLARDGRAAASLVLPLPATPEASVSVALQTPAQPEPIATLALPDLAQARARAFLEQRLVFNGVFTTPEFPTFDFEQPALVEDLIGLYEIKTTYYDAQYQEVKTADKPGRYGAVVTITAPAGLTTRRFCTLFRAAQDFKWWRVEMPVSMELPKELGLDATVVKTQASTFAEPLKWAVVDGSIRRGGFGDVFAGLSEIPASAPKATVYDDWSARNRSWWLGLKRKLYGADTKYTTPVQNPVTVDGQSAPIVHPGTLAEAKMKPDTVEQLDALLKTWAADSDEGFNVCVVRNGVIVHHGAYGTRDGKPFTTETKSYLASITKAFSGTALMMAVDQGLLSLDDPADKYLPPFRGPAGRKSPTLRQLYTHTAGMWDHRDKPEDDLAETLSIYLPYLKIGQKHEYNGTSLAIGSSILELVSGESLPAYYKKHLLDPLGMKNTDILNSSYNTRGTAYDLALFGQMLLNKGAYGNLRFMKPETFQQQLPHLLTKELAPDTKTEWGIGLVWMNPEKTNFGHGSASSCTFLIYPEQKLIITMTRNAAGTNWGKYNDLFVKLVHDCFAESPAPATAPH